MTKNNKIHITGHSKETKENFVNIGDKFGITTPKDLFDICSTCPNFFGCTKKQELYLMLKENKDIDK